MKKLQRLGIAALAVVALACPVLARVPGSHPHYIHTLSDLRAAASLINSSRHIDHNQERALAEINQAINEVGQAAAADQENLSNFPPPDVDTVSGDRLSRVRRCLEAAQANLSQREDNPGAFQWQQSALRDTANAIRHIDRAIHDRYEHRND